MTAPSGGITRRRVARATRAGGPEVIEVGTEELAPLAETDVLVRVGAAGLNHADTLVRSGAYAVSRNFPYAVGLEAAGEVVAAGPEAGFEVGARVCGTGWWGSCADVVVVHAERLVRVPDGLGLEAAACVAHAASAAGALARVWPLEGRTAVVWGAAGAVGRVLVGLLADRGVRVIGIASGDRVEVVRELGAAHVIDRHTEDPADVVMARTGGNGVSAVFDPVAAETFDASLGMLAPRGCLINYGELTGPVPDGVLHALFRAGGVFLTKFNSSAYVDGFGDIVRIIAESLDLAVRVPAVVSPIAGRFSLDEVVDAFTALESGANGKVLVVPAERTG